MKDLQKAIEEILDNEDLRIDLANYFMSFPNWDHYSIAECSAADVQLAVKRSSLEKLTQLITSREQEIREETIMKCMALVNTHTEHNGNYCDTGEDMDWACRSECVDMAEARLELYLAQQKESK